MYVCGPSAHCGRVCVFFVLCLCAHQLLCLLHCIIFTLHRFTSFEGNAILNPWDALSVPSTFMESTLCMFFISPICCTHPCATDTHLIYTTATFPYFCYVNLDIGVCILHDQTDSVWLKTTTGNYEMFTVARLVRDSTVHETIHQLSRHCARLPTDFVPFITDSLNRIKQARDHALAQGFVPMPLSVASPQQREQQQQQQQHAQQHAHPLGDISNVQSATRPPAPLLAAQPPKRGPGPLPRTLRQPRLMRGMPRVCLVCVLCVV